MGERIDAGVGGAVEKMARRLSRRDAMRTAVIGGAAGVAALALGQRPALAVTCDCGPTVHCSHYKNRHCPSGAGCPTGYTLCKNSSSAYCSCEQGHYNWQGFCCEWSAGSWIACSGLGKGHGYEVCSDCLGPGGECTYWCTCLSSCICCDCTTAKDVKEEHKRLMALGSS
jgi:hypothetical protein